ncbi:MAG TPA: hypothetical protein VL463_23310, partial [Kofleriaceae bacterium]|nr:hypothetical protein [Kofleriaceae bacterium]
MKGTATIAIAVALVACGGNDRGTHVMMDWTRANGLFDAPFPANDLFANEHVDVSKFPNPKQVTLIEQARALAAERDGFANTAGIYMRTSAPIDPAGLP